MVSGVVEVVALPGSVKGSFCRSFLFPIGAHKVRMQRAQHSKTRKSAASGALIEAEGCLELLRYAAPVGLISSWADLGLWPRRFPPERELTADRSALYLLYYHKADATSQTFALSSQHDVLLVACQSTGRIGPRPNMPRPEGIQLAKRL